VLNLLSTSTNRLRRADQLARSKGSALARNIVLDEVCTGALGVKVHNHYHVLVVPHNPSRENKSRRTMAARRQRLQLRLANQSRIRVSADNGRDAEAAAVGRDVRGGDGRGRRVASRAGEDAQGDGGEARGEHRGRGGGCGDGGRGQDEGGKCGSELHSEFCLGDRAGRLVKVGRSVD
jgi:hypothetical protein